MMRNERLSLPFDQGLIEAVGDAPVVAIRANPATVYEQFDTLVCVQGFKPVYDTLKQQGLPVVSELPQGQTASMVIVELTRSKAETLANIATGYGILEPGGTLVVDGMKTDGIESILKAVKKLLPVEGTLSKAHGKVFWLTKTDTPPEFADWAKALTPARNAEGYFTAAGMFSPDAADAGSALLAGKIGDRLKGKGADLGAGWGWLARQALDSNAAITSLALYEAENTALACARRNITDPRAEFHWADVCTLTGPSDHDFVVMNPPFHQSRKAEPELGRQFIHTAAKLLHAKGTLWMVANRQLAYEAALTAHFHTWEYLEQSPGFKCVRATRPKH